VGNDGETLVADSSASTGLRYQPNFSAGKNKIINGDFGIWQRGTSFTNPATQAYTTDRFYINRNASTGTVSRQTFTPGSAPVAGYEGQYFFRWAQTGSGANTNAIGQPIENVQTFAGQVITLSFWAKANVAITLNPIFYQVFGSGGSGTASQAAGGATLTSNWTRYTQTITLASIAGKTIGTNSGLYLEFQFTSATTTDIDLWGVQLEYGAVATAFQTATGTIQGELAACQRYLPAITATGGNCEIASGFNVSTTQAFVMVPFQVPARVQPTGITATPANMAVRNLGGSLITLTALSFNNSSPMSCAVLGTVASGLVAGQGTSMTLQGTILFTGCEL
jgi:hypothetical protein